MSDKTASRSDSSLAASAQPKEAPRPSEKDDQAACNAGIARVLAEPSAEGTSQLDARRARLFIAVKGEPVLFVHPPERLPTDDVGIVAYRRWLDTSAHPGGVVAELVDLFQGRPELARATLLRDGYVYADDFALGDALVRYLRADLLFNDPEIWIQRGDQVLHAVKDPKRKRYVYSDGPQVGRSVSLLLFDRVGTGPVPEPVHRDVRSLRYRLGFRRIRVQHLTAEQIVADLEYGHYWVPTLLDAHGARLERVCELLPPSFDGEEERVRADEIRRNRAFQVVQRAIAVQIDDALPFDEPKHEVGQEDGKLRPNWQYAYMRGNLAYKYREDEYPVFGPKGHPLVPEVCVDFLLDTIERAGGTWWRSRGEPRERVVGRIDFDVFDHENRRRAPEFVEFVRAHPEWFDLLEIPEREQIPMGHEEDFTRYLVDHVADFNPGDMILIGGYVPWDPRQYVHYHSFFVFESDPLTGMPLLVAGNPGTPSLRTWRVEMRRTPRRTLRFRVRPQPEWLASVVLPDTGETPPPLLAQGL